MNEEEEECEEFEVVFDVFSKPDFREEVFEDFAETFDFDEFHQPEKPVETRESTEFDVLGVFCCFA